MTNYDEMPFIDFANACDDSLNTRYQTAKGITMCWDFVAECQEAGASPDEVADNFAQRNGLLAI